MPGFRVVPAEFAARTVLREHEAGRDWIDRLPALVDRLLREWGLMLTGPPVAGTVGLVWEVGHQDGSRYMLKPVHGPSEWDLVPLLRNRFDEYPQGRGLVQGTRERLDALVVATGSAPGRAALFAHYRALRDADYARRSGDSGFEEVSRVVADATDRGTEPSVAAG